MDCATAAAAASAASPAAPTDTDTTKEVAYFDVVMADGAMDPVVTTPVGKKKRKRPDSSTCSDDDEEDQCGGGNRGDKNKKLAANSTAAVAPAGKSAMVSIENLLRMAKGRAHAQAATSNGPDAVANDLDDDAAEGKGGEGEEEAGVIVSCLSWKVDDDIPNTVMQLPPILPQLAIANPQLYAARRKLAADADRRRRREEQERQQQRKRSGGTSTAVVVGGNNADGNAKKRPKKDPNLPKKARSAYSYFVVEFHENLKAEQQQQQQQQQAAAGEEKKDDEQEGGAISGNNDDDQQRKKFTEMGKKMGQQWRNLSEHERKRYDDMATQDKARYAKEMEVYVAQKQREEKEASESSQHQQQQQQEEEEEEPKSKMVPRTPAATNRLVAGGNRSTDGGVLGNIGGGRGSIGPSPRTKTPAKLIKSALAPEIGDGWTVRTYQRQTGTSAGTTDSYWYSPALEKKFRSLKEITRFKEALKRVHEEAGGEGKLDAAHAEQLAWMAFKDKKAVASSGAKKKSAWV